MNLRRIEDIYPMTTVHMRHGKFAILEVISECECVSMLQECEELQYDPHHYMKEEWEHINYGIGNTLLEAFEDYKQRL